MKSKNPAMILLLFTVNKTLFVLLENEIVTKIALLWIDATFKNVLLYVTFFLRIVLLSFFVYCNNMFLCFVKVFRILQSNGVERVFTH